MYFYICIPSCLKKNHLPECEHQGTVYANGEKIPSSGEDCKVCYCRGGEIKCTDVTCYLRTDCEAKQVPGQCCPKYDNCPGIEKKNCKKYM